ncbi:MAG: autotransporter-associated beta strand repeat-containing protein, partial [Planctomycetota bacterium]|nr:autotransporter-associated beta strand repeat-containing protein [Planctomycetota bacterium]
MVGGTGSPAINLNGGSAAVNTITVDPAVTAEVAVKLTGAAGMTKAGQGTLVLSGANDYTGQTIVKDGGTLKLAGTISAQNAWAPVLT